MPARVRPSDARLAMLASLEPVVAGMDTIGDRGGLSRVAAIEE